MGNQLDIPMHSHSLEVWYNQIVPTLSEREKSVFEAIKILGACTGRDLELYLQRTYSSFSGRITSLKKKKAIKKIGTVYIKESPFSVYSVNPENI